MRWDMIYLVLVRTRSNSFTWWYYYFYDASFFSQTCYTDHLKIGLFYFCLPELIFMTVMKGTDLSKANLKEAQFSKGFLQGPVYAIAYYFPFF